MSGVKRLTPDNWTEPDAVNANFVRFSPLVGAVTINGEDWARHILAVELADHVPSEITELFAVARGAMLYGWFYYPLFRLGKSSSTVCSKRRRDSGTASSTALGPDRSSPRRSPTSATQRRSQSPSTSAGTLPGRCGTSPRIQIAPR